MGTVRIVVCPNVFSSQRAGGPGGFDFWVAYMAAGNSGQALIAGFLNSPEYHNRFLP